jgi:serine phosphatase RsbU (regulator of sigma subunit)
LHPIRRNDGSDLVATLRDDHAQTESPLSSYLRASLPPSLPEIDGLQFEALYLPCADSVIGGDWYDVLQLPDGSVAIAVGDVSGHGIEAAAIMGKIRYSMRVVIMRMNALHMGSPAVVLPCIEDGLRSEHPKASATTFLGIISPDRTHMQYATAGHPPPLALTTSGETLWLEGSDVPLGWGGGCPRNDHLVDLTEVSRLILYTDGVIEAGRDIVKGLEHLRTALARADICNGPDLLPRLVEASLQAPPHDDIAMLAVTFEESAVSS